MLRQAAGATKWTRRACDAAHAEAMLAHRRTSSRAIERGAMVSGTASARSEIRVRRRERVEDVSVGVDRLDREDSSEAVHN